MSNRNKNILLGVLIVGVISMTIAFAALSTRLNINGNANVAATKWNIRFENWQKETISTVNGHSNTAVSPEVESLTKEDETNITKVSNVNVTLNQPGDKARYTFEIANRGTIDGKLDNFTVTDTSENNLVGYEVKCYDNENLTGNEIDVNYVLGVEQRVYCYLEIEYKDQTNNKTAGENQVYQQPQISTSLTASWTWIQDDSTSNNQQGGSQGGSSYSGPYATTFDGTYTYTTFGLYETDEYGFVPKTFNSDWIVYLRNDGSKDEACLNGDSTAASGTVCLINVPNNSSDFATCSTSGTGEFTSSNIDNSCLTGYTKAKAVEMLSKGASSCEVDHESVSCSWSDNSSCSIILGAESMCSTSSGYYCAIGYLSTGYCDY